MSGNVEVRQHPGWLSRLAQQRLTYFAVDGGTGAHHLAALVGQSPHLTPVATPRHADCLVIVAPIAPKLAPALQEIARALPANARVIVYRDPDRPETAAGDAPEARLFPNAHHITSLTAAAVRAAYDQAQDTRTLSEALALPDDVTIDLPASPEIATEFVVLSLGPVQPFTAGPARFWLICDGEQVVECRVETGYAARAISGLMTGTSWEAAATLAAQYDPLAPIAGRRAFVQAIEQIQGHQPDDFTQAMRANALALERAQNALWWYARFLRLIALAPLATRAAALAVALDEVIAEGWPETPASWIAPQRSAPPLTATAQSVIPSLTRDLAVLTRTAAADRWLKLRTARIGVISQQQMTPTPLSGPIMEASMQGDGDVQSRIVARLRLATSALADIGDHTSISKTAVVDSAQWQVHAGEATGSVAGPRGDLRVQVSSDGGMQPRQIIWHAPSSDILTLIPTLLAGQKVADAEIILASLDLVMAEVDG